MERLTKILFALMVTSLTGCNDDELNLEYTNLKTIVIGDYRFEFPSQFRLIEEQGIDSFVGKVVGSGIELKFDFGVYTSPIENLPSNSYEVLNETFGSVERQIIIGLDTQENFAGIHIRDLNNFSFLGNYVSLWMGTRDISQEQQNLVIKIFESAELIE